MIGIVVPTLNRPQWLKRQLKYFSDVGFTGTMYIADSSEPLQFKEFSDAIPGLAGNVRVEHLPCPGMNEMEAVHLATERTREPFVVIAGDDDFLIPNSLRKCIDFLEANADYATAHGLAIQASFEVNEGVVAVPWVAKYKLRSVEQETGVMRLFDFFNSYFVPLYSVHRTPELLIHTGIVKSIPNSPFREIGASALGIIAGKSRELDFLHLIRGHHQQRVVQPDHFDWICRPQWATSYELFSSALAKELQQQDGISAEESAEIVKRAYWRWLAEALNRKWQQRYGGRMEHIHPMIESLGARAPALRDRLRTLRSFIPTERGRLTLDALRRRSSPYYADFEPFYRSITARPAIPEPHQWTETNASQCP